MYCIFLQGCSWWFEIKFDYHPAVCVVSSMTAATDTDEPATLVSRKKKKNPVQRLANIIQIIISAKLTTDKLANKLANRSAKRTFVVRRGNIKQSSFTHNQMLHCLRGCLTDCGPVTPYVFLELNIGSGKGLGPDDTKTSPEFLLTTHQCSRVALTWERFHKK